MIHFGDIVRPIESCIGHQFEFVVRYDSPLPKFKLKATNNIIDPMYGPYEFQMEEMERAEEWEWCANDLELVENGPTLSQALEANHIIFEEFLQNEKYRHNALNILTENSCECNINNIKDIPQEIKVSGKNLFDDGELMYNYYKNIKEDKTMKILEIYKERKEQAIYDDYEKIEEAVLAEDEMQKIINEMTNQVNALLESENRTDFFYVESEGFTLTETNEKLDKLNEEKEDEILQLDKTIEEIEAMFEMTEDYEERMKILKKYGIINKDGKLSI